MVLSYFPPERSSEVWEEASASTSLISQLFFSEGVSFSEAEIHRGRAFGLRSTPFSWSVSLHDPLEVSLAWQPLGESMHAL